jgi:hypothetical protein
MLTSLAASSADDASSSPLPQPGRQSKSAAKSADKTLILNVIWFPRLVVCFLPRLFRKTFL